MRYNFPIVYGPKTVFYDPPNGTDSKLVVSNRISLCILDMTETVLLRQYVMTKFIVNNRTDA